MVAEQSFRLSILRRLRQVYILYRLISGLFSKFVKRAWEVRSISSNVHVILQNERIRTENAKFSIMQFIALINAYSYVYQ